MIGTTTTKLTRREQQVVDFLNANPGPQSIVKIAEMMYGFADATSRQSVRVWVSRLRDKGVAIITIHSRGIMLGDCNHVFVCATCGIEAN